MCHLTNMVLLVLAPAVCSSKHKESLREPVCRVSPWTVPGAEEGGSKQGQGPGHAGSGWAHAGRTSLAAQLRGWPASRAPHVQPVPSF